MSKLTSAEVRALTAVVAGTVIRVYRRNGNILRGPHGVGAAVLWRLDAKKFLADGNNTTGGYVRTCVQIVTPAGREALTTSESAP